VTTPNARRGFDWEAAGREIGQTLAEYHAVVVVGSDPVATGRVAVGLAREQALQRRVAIGDLFAESPPIQELVTTDDPHGLVDSFLYGISLSRIAQPVPDAGQLFVMPSGTEPPDYEEILPSPRWHRLAAGFREVGALLVLAAPATAPQIVKLVSATDGVVLVGDTVPAEIPVSRVITSVREPRRQESPSPIVGVPHAPQRMWSRTRVAATAGVGLTVVAAAVAAWLAYRPLADSGKSPLRKVPDCAALAAAGHPCAPTSGAGVAIRPDSAGRDSSADTAAGPAVTLVPPAVANPADSSNSVPFAVQLMAANTEAGAILKLQKDGKDLPAATFAPAIIQGARWFKVVSGAFGTRAGADSLLNTLRRRNMLLGNESVVKLPFAFLIDSGVPAAAVPRMVAEFANRGQPVYALRQANGGAWLLVGAYDSPEQAALYLESLKSIRASGFQPVLVYRKGRPF